jgi:hypothetical protein
MSSKLFGPVYPLSSEPRDLLIGLAWSRALRIGKIIPGKPASLRIDRNGEPVDWAPAHALQLIGISKPEVGLPVIVRGEDALPFPLRLGADTEWSLSSSNKTETAVHETIVADS